MKQQIVDVELSVKNKSGKLNVWCYIWRADESGKQKFRCYPVYDFQTTRRHRPQRNQSRHIRRAMQLQTALFEREI